MLTDMDGGSLTITDEDQFGRDVATTEGVVVFENDLFQLIQYRATTAEVCSRPLLSFRRVSTNSTFSICSRIIRSFGLPWTRTDRIPCILAQSGRNLR